MKKLLVLLLSFTVLLFACGAGHGKKVKINDYTEVYLKGDNVTEAEARKLGDFFVKTFDGQKQNKSFQLSKEDTVYVVKMVVDEEKVKNDKSLDVSFMAVQVLLEIQAFPGKKVKLVLTDNQFKDIKSFDGASSEAKTDSVTNN